MGRRAVVDPGARGRADPAILPARLPMLRVVHSNRTEALLDALVRRLRASRADRRDPLRPVQLVVPNRHVESYVELGVARGLGIAANLRFTRPHRWAAEAVGAGDGVLGGPALIGRVLAALDAPDLPPALRRYLDAAPPARLPRGRRRAQLARHLGGLFEEYVHARDDMLTAWAQGGAVFDAGPASTTEAWQAALWRRLRDGDEPPTLAEALARRASRRSAPGEPPDEVHVFGLSYVAPLFARILATAAAEGTVVVYALNPCEEFWEDVESPAEQARRERLDPRGELAWVILGEDPFGLAAAETPLLRLWGRPGREHVRLLGALTACDVDAAFVDPLTPPDDPGTDGDLPLFAPLRHPALLHRVQHDILTRATVSPPPTSALRDPSLQVLACPSLRREVETVAADIWSLLDEIPDLRLPEIAVLALGPDRDAYLPHIEAVFQAARDLPYQRADVALAAASPVVDAALKLLALPLGRATRPEVLEVIGHSAFAGRRRGTDPAEWADLAERLAIFHGLDREAHAGTYVPGDHLSWDQGLTRLALGAFVDGSDGRPVTLGAQRYVPETPDDLDGPEARFALVVRSLISDLRFARGEDLPLTAWARFAGAMLTAYLEAADDGEAAALRRAIAAVEGLAAYDARGDAVPYSVAEELARHELSDLGGGGAQARRHGVVVSTLLPMRALPFRVIFVLGLGEGRFPASDRRDAMDLRAARRRAGDVTPAERDRYAFLETLLSARDRLILSYVARDERTGEPLAPAVVLTELLEAVEEGYLPAARERLVFRPPLRRHEATELTASLPAAASEARAAALGRAVRAEVREVAGASLGPEDLLRLASDAGLRDDLGLVRLPEPRRADAAAADELRLHWAALRRFLESPLQGWARAALHLTDDDEHHGPAAADEPFAPSSRVEATVLRGALNAHLLEGAGLGDAYRVLAEAEAARGQWPLGIVAEMWAERHREVLQRWVAAAGELVDAEGALRRIRFGAATEETPGVEAAPAVVVAFDEDPRDRGSGRPLRVELVGATDLLAASGTTSLLPLPRAPRGRVDKLRRSLKALLGQVALAASGRAEGEPHRALLVAGDRDGAPDRVAFGGWTQAEAAAWLQRIVGDLLGGPHPYLLPCEAVFRLRSADARGEEIVQAVRHVRDQGGGSARYGPVRDPLAVPAPAAGRAEAIVAARFGPILRRLRDGA